MDDSISREAAVDAIYHHLPSVSRTRARTMLHEVPSAQPERKKGKWEEKEVSDEKVIDEWQSARCSACGKYHTAPYMYYFNNYNYCPNCGAKMI